MTGGGWSESRYRAHLDGLRAVAVYLVVAFHAGADRLSGGFIGVDVFFVLSGYLVTQLLLRDLHRHTTVRWGRFYARRVRRLLPAAVVNLVVTAAVFAAIAPPARFQDAQDAIRAAALYVSNWYFIGQATNYFAADIARSPVIHYWSLSVEEQFYLLWPVLLFAIVWVARRWRSRERLVTRSVVIVCGLASVIAALLIARTDTPLAYFATYTRAYQLLAGAALALTPGLMVRLRQHRTVSRLLGVIAGIAIASLLVVATDLIAVGPVTRGVLAATITVVLLAALEAAPERLIGRALSVGPVTYLGRISYGTYLWHWIAILVITDAYAPGPAATFLLATLVATGVASLSYQLLEQPIRASAVLDRVRTPVIAVGLAASLLVGLVVSPRMFEDQGPDRAAVAASGDVGGTPNHADWRAAEGDNFKFAQCPVTSLATWQPTPCPLVRGRGQTVAIVGDSHATMLTPMLMDLARRRGLRLTGAFFLACPWTWGVRYAAANPACFDHQDQIFQQVIPRIDPDIVILAHRPVDAPGNGEALLDRKAGALKDVTQERAALRRSIDAVVQNLRAAGRKVVIVEPIPVPPAGDDPLDCLSKAPFLEECRFVVSTKPTTEEQIIRSVASADPGVWSMDLDRLICPYLPICDPVVDGLVPRTDDNHITVTFGRTLRAPVERFLVDNGILSSS